MTHINKCPGCFNDISGNYPCPSCGYTGPTEEATLYLPPNTILAGKYQIGRVLGQGGFGITYLGWDLNLDMKLAIKEFFPQGLVSRLPGHSKVITLAGTESQQFAFWQDRFLQEAKTLARFEQHPNIVSVRDYFKANNTAYMIMSYVEGHTLEAYLKKVGGKLPYNKAIEIMMPVMDALREVHEAGIMHRDISPDNIFIDNRGRVVLLDFGAARQELRDISKSLSVILKAGYAPEEQYRSRGKQGPWTDVYSVAATIYHLITGNIPPESIDRMAEDTLIDPSGLGVDISPKQEKHLLKALEVKAPERYQSVKEFQYDLQDVAKDVYSGGYQENLTNNNTPEQLHIPKATEDPTCPFCLQQIKSDAKTCPHCQEKLTALENKPNDALFLKPAIVDVNCPVEVEAVVVTLEDGVEIVADLKINNSSSGKDVINHKKDTVVALKLKLYCFNSFNEPVEYQGNNIMSLTLQDLSIKPESQFKYPEYIELDDYSDARRINVMVETILYKDDRLWQYREETLLELKTDMLDSEELQDLQALTGNDAVCYAHEEVAFWQCVCGRGNAPTLNYCIRCKRDKSFALKSFANKRVVIHELSIIRERQQEEAQRKVLEVVKEQKRNTIIIVALLIIAVLAVVLATTVLPANHRKNQYEEGLNLLNAGQYAEASTIFAELGDYNDSTALSDEALYLFAQQLKESGNYDLAIKAFESLGTYKASRRLLSETNSLAEQKYLMGNTSGNLANNGYAVHRDAWIYHVTNSGAINRVHIDGSGRSNITDGPAAFLNLVGDWIYFQNIGDENRIYKVHVDGSGRELVTDDSAKQLNVVGSYIYYTNQDDSNRLYKINVDGNGREKINDDIIVEFAIQGDWIIYSNRYASNGLYRMRTDGSNRVKITEDSSIQINIVGDWIYYVNLSDYRRIYRVKIDGSNREVATSSDADADSLNVVGENIYISSVYNNRIYEYRSDSKIRLNENTSRLLNIADDWIYYKNPIEDGQFYRLRLDGSEEQLVE